ncbi:MAG: response regulator transcription factor [Spirochaetales bacterium]|nr:response regulator transcription factor [Spirochaetales bacterium]
MGKYSFKSFSLEKDESYILSCPAPTLWVVEVDPKDLKSLLLIKKLVGRRNESVLVLSREKSFPFRSECYQMGVDDFVEEPWFPRVIALRIEAIFRRRSLCEKDKTEIKWFYEGMQYQLDLDHHHLTIDGKDVDLTPSQWNLFSALILHGNRAVSREYLLSECLSLGNRKTRTLDNHMKNLRHNIGSGEMIETVRGYGYRLKGEAC